MSRVKTPTTSRSEGWIEILGGVETAIQRTLSEALRREETPAAPSGTDPSGCFSRLAESSQRWSGLWLRSAEGEKVLSDAEQALASAENGLRKHLDALVACRQNLAQWLERAVG